MLIGVGRLRDLLLPWLLCVVAVILTPELVEGGRTPKNLTPQPAAKDLSAHTLNNLTIPFAHAGVLMTLAGHTCGGAAATMVL